MVVDMKLDLIPYSRYLSGKKTCELRLYDEKRRRLRIGDHIIFHCGNRSNGAEDVLTARVTAIYLYASFADLFSELSPEQCGFEPGTSPTDAAAYMERYYTADEIKAYGVIAFRLTLTDLKDALAQKEAEALSQA